MGDESWNTERAVGDDRQGAIDEFTSSEGFSSSDVLTSPEDYFDGSEIQGVMSRETFDQLVQALMSEDPEFASMVTNSPDPQTFLDATFQEALAAEP